MNFDRHASSGYMANWAARLFAKAIDTRLRPLGLTSAYMPVFFALIEHGELSQRSLTEAAAVEQPTMAATLQRMARDGLVEKRPDPADGRGALYRLSKHGKEMSEKAREHGRAVHTAALAGMSEAERVAMLTALARVVANLDDLISKDG